MANYLRIFAGATGAVLLLAAGAANAHGMERVTDRVFLVRDKPGSESHFEMIVHAGCNEEAAGDCRGLSHYLEHLILNALNPERDIIAARFFPDGYSNRYTSYEHRIAARPAPPVEELKELFRFYAARLQSFHATEAEAARERSVVLQEYNYRIEHYPARKFDQRCYSKLHFTCG
jgi:predicted Zn-dependent peptidase